MRKFHKLLLLAIVFCLVGAPSTAVGDWEVGDPYKMHYPQMPDPEGWDICLNCQYIADDFGCTETGVITDIHIWVSWRYEEVDWDNIRIHLERCPRWAGLVWLAARSKAVDLGTR